MNTFFGLGAGVRFSLLALTAKNKHHRIFLIDIFALAVGAFGKHLDVARFFLRETVRKQVRNLRFPYKLGVTLRGPVATAW